MRKFLVGLGDKVDAFGEQFSSFVEDKVVAFMGFFARIENPILRIVAFTLAGVVPFLAATILTAAVIGVLAMILVVVGVTAMAADVVQGRAEFFR